MDLETTLPSLNPGRLHRVQNTSKTITWTYSQGDPSPISIVIVNEDATVLNGAFSIQEYVDVSVEVP